MKHTATYSPEDNKIRIYPAHRLSKEDYDRVRAAGFIWAPKQEIFVAPMWTPGREDIAEELCGEIGDEDTSLVDRAEQRADRFSGYSENRTRDAENARKAVSAIADNIPFGQPILVGHHSERHARKDAQRIENGMRKAVKMWATAGYWKSRASGAIHHAKYKELPAVRNRRIKGLESELRGYEREVKRAELMLGLWKDGLTHEGTKAIANLDSIYILDANGNRGSLWSLLTDGKIDAETAIRNARQAHTRAIANQQRWIEHVTNRLTYERAMLAESGWTPPAKPKTKAALPLLNYSGEIAYRNPWQRGEIVRVQAVGITKAELARINTDYKGTRVSECGTHRVRTAILGGPASRGLVAIFLTDSKEHKRPTAEAVTAQAESEEVAAEALSLAKMKAAQERAATPRPAPDEREAEFEAMKKSLREGVKTVAVPQLFPTPAQAAAPMVVLADIQPGQSILEPSAGTGRLVDAILQAHPDADIIAVEIDKRLIEALRPKCTAVKCGDFLESNGDLGKFDRILMNPPFENGADIKHIKHAVTFLNPGGKLVAICAAGPRQREELQPLGFWEDLPPDTFKSEGTSVRTALLIIEAPKA